MRIFFLIGVAALFLSTETAHAAVYILHWYSDKPILPQLLVLVFVVIPALTVFGLLQRHGMRRDRVKNLMEHYSRQKSPNMPEVERKKALKDAMAMYDAEHGWFGKEFRNWKRPRP